MTEQEIVLETIEYYKTHNRGIDRMGRWSYLNDMGDMCAVGRCMKKKALDRYGSFTGSTMGIATVEGKDTIDSLLKKKYSGHSMNFWRDLQNLHDGDLYWEGANLTKSGRDFVERAFNLKING